MRVRCIDTRGYLEPHPDGFRVAPQPGTVTDLTRGKLYDVLADEDGFYRIVDDTGEDYLYPHYMFEPVGVAGPGGGRDPSSTPPPEA